MNPPARDACATHPSENRYRAHSTQGPAHSHTCRKAGSSDAVQFSARPRTRFLTLPNLALPSPAGPPRGGTRPTGIRQVSHLVGPAPSAGGGSHISPTFTDLYRALSGARVDVKEQGPERWKSAPFTLYGVTKHVPRGTRAVPLKGSLTIKWGCHGLDFVSESGFGEECSEDKERGKEFGIRCGKLLRGAEAVAWRFKTWRGR